MKNKGLINNQFYLIVLLLLLSFSITTDSEYKESLEDYDGDGLPDAYELANGNDPYDRNDVSKDADGDGLTIQEEFIYGTSDQNPDTDFDTLPDAWEIAQGRNPLLADYQISTGAESSCALTDNGVVCWGKDNGSLDVPDLYNPTAIAVGSTFACALENSEEICWGDNQESLIGKPSLTEGICAIEENGIVCQNEVTFGSPPLIENPAQVSAGESSACALAPDGVTCWGYNLNGENDVPALVIDPDGDGYSNQGGMDAFPLDPTRWLEEIASIEVNQTGDLDFIFTYGDSGTAIAGVKVVMTESDGTVTVLATDANGQITLPSTTNTFTLSASLAEAGEDPITLVDALQIIQYAGELRTLTADQIKAADVNNDGEVDVLDALWIIQHQGELRTLDSSLIFLDTNTGKPLSETTFSSSDIISISTIRTGDVDQDFDPTLITDHAPIITGSASFSAAENQTAIGTVTASDADGDSLTFSISGSEINISSSGVLTFATAPDYETKNSYTATVTVTDGTASATQGITVSVTDVSENSAPTFTSSASFSAAENQTAIGTVTASDADGDSLTFSISGSEINISSSGVLTFATAPDYETKNSYTATVTVTDGTASATQGITVSVTDVSENSAPTFTSSASFSAAENQTAIGTVTASDADGDSLTFSISGSEINISSSGVLTFATAPDYETKNSYTATVTVTDGTASATQGITVSVTDVEETTNQAPVYSLNNTYIVNEGVVNVFQINATDPENDSLTVSLTGNDASAFAVSASGVVSFTYTTNVENPLDSNADTVYNITVNVTDGTTIVSQNINVVLANIDEAGEIYYIWGSVTGNAQYLGCFAVNNSSCNNYSTESICNEYGTYGSEYSSTSIWNEYGTYGSIYNTKSPWNPYSIPSNTPYLYNYNTSYNYGAFTVNSYNSDLTSSSVPRLILQKFLATNSHSQTRDFACD